MGTWGAGPFDNDGAHDLLRNLGDAAEPMNELRGLLQRIAATPTSEYLDVDDGQHAVAAAQLVVFASGGDPIPKRLLMLVERLAVDRSDRALAQQALARVTEAGSSELASLWGGSNIRLADLGARLAAEPGPSN